MDHATSPVKIPIENIYYLLCYAWNRLDQGELTAVDTTEATTLVDLFAAVLATGLAHILRRGLDRGYILHELEIPGVRGKLQISSTAKLALRRKAHAMCLFDELSYDIPTNQIIKATIRRLLSLGSSDLSQTHRSALIELFRRLYEVSDVSLSRSLFRKSLLHRNNSYYGFLLDVCWILSENLLPEEQSGRTVFRDFIRDDRQMPLLFQQFVFNFLRRHTKYSVKSPQINWHDVQADVAALDLLPKMQTDIVITSANRCLVIDTKYYADALQRRFKKTLHSGNLYQMYAYMRNLQHARIDGNVPVEGILLYPAVTDTLDLSYVIEGHRLRVHTINLNQDWRAIQNDLLQIVA